MVRQLFTNNASSTLYGTLPIGGTTLILASGTGEQFPSPASEEFFLITLYEKDESGNEINIEVAKCTSRIADTLTIEGDVEEIVGTAGGLGYPSAVGKTVFILEFRINSADFCQSVTSSTSPVSKLNLI